MITAVAVILTLQLLSYIAMVVAMVFNKSRLVNLFFFGVYDAWRGSPCVKFYRNVTKLNSYGRHGTFI